MAQITDGNVRYVICNALDTHYCLDVSGNSTANYANVNCHSRNDGNNQLFRVQPYNGTLSMIRCCNSGKAVEVAKAKDANNANVSMFNTNKTVAQRWYLLPDNKTTLINGHAYPTYLLVALGKTNGRVMDVASSAQSANVRINPRTGSAGQRFCFVPSSQRVASFPVPSAGGASLSATSGGTSLLQATSGTVYPSWKSSVQGSQVRYTKRYRKRGDGSWTGWERWRDIKNRADDAFGWGADCTVAHCYPSETDGRRRCPYGVPFTIGNDYDRMDVRFEVRHFNPAYGKNAVPSHGGSLTFEVKVVRPITITTLTLGYTPNGAIVSWVTNDGVGTIAKGYTAKVECPALFPATSVTINQDEYTRIPQSKMYKVPSEGETYTVKLTVTSKDGATATKTQVCTVTYDTGHGTGVTAGGGQVSGTTLSRVTASASCEAYLLVPRGHGDRFVPLGTGTSFTFPPPLGVPYRVFFVNGSASAWGTTVKEYPAIVESTPTYHITSQDLAHDLAIAYRVDNPGPEFKPTYTRSRTEYETFGRERPIYGFSEATRANITLTGDLVGDGQLDEVDWFAHDSHVYLRDPRGFWAQCAVGSVSVDLSKVASHEVSASLDEEVW